MLARELTRRLAELVPVETITTVKYPDDVSFLESTVSQPTHLLSQPGVVTGDGHSDFGAVLTNFTKSFAGTAIRKKTTVLITGDARNNYRDPNASSLSGHARSIGLTPNRPPIGDKQTVPSSRTAPHARPCSKYAPPVNLPPPCSRSMPRRAKCSASGRLNPDARLE
jgi:hypothetical protein